jgi:cyclohexyl-isocyanide hydratase
MLLLPGMTQLDLTGPWEVLSRVPDWKIDLIAETMEPVAADKGFTIMPDVTFENAKAYDILAVPGGPGIDVALSNTKVVDFVRSSGTAAEYVFGICTGSLLLGAAGLLQGKRSGGHWQARDLLSSFGAEVSNDRMTIDGNLFTAGGVTSGIDMAIRVVAELEGEDVAQQIQLQIEYDPEPPFNAGTPYVAPQEIIDRALNATTKRRELRIKAVEDAAKGLGV